MREHRAAALRATSRARRTGVLAAVALLANVSSPVGGARLEVWDWDTPVAATAQDVSSSRHDLAATPPLRRPVG